MLAASASASGWTRAPARGTWVSTMMTGRPSSWRARTNSASVGSEAPVAGPHAVPRDVDLLGQVCGIHPVQVVAQLADQAQRCPGPTSTRGCPGTPERPALVEVEVLGPGDRLADPGGRGLAAEDAC